MVGTDDCDVDEDGKEFEKRSSVSLHCRKGTRLGCFHVSIVNKT